LTAQRPALDHLFIPPESLGSGHFELAGEEFFHLKKVKRARAGEEVTWSDGAGSVGRAVIEEASASVLRLRVIESGSAERRPPSIHLLQALPKGGKMDEVVRKNVEAGVDAFHPFTSSRSLPRPGSKDYRERLERWRKIAREASRQSRREFLPVVDPPRSWEECLGLLSGFETALVAWEGEKRRRVAEALPAGPPERLALVVGPEGGFDGTEIEELKRAGAVPVSLGRNILRTENAGMVLAVLAESRYGLL
jgi:16S rRNA (uracil1498-N3)-methyltransferase